MITNLKNVELRQARAGSLEKDGIGMTGCSSCRLQDCPAMRRDIAAVKSPHAVFQRSPTSSGIGRRREGQGRKVAPAWGVLGVQAILLVQAASVGFLLCSGMQWWMESAFDFSSSFFVCHCPSCLSPYPLFCPFLHFRDQTPAGRYFVARPSAQPCYAIYPLDLVHLSPSAHLHISAFRSRTVSRHTEV